MVKKNQADGRQPSKDAFTIANKDQANARQPTRDEFPEDNFTETTKWRELPLGVWEIRAKKSVATRYGPAVVLTVGNESEDPRDVWAPERAYLRDVAVIVLVVVVGVADLAVPSTTVVVVGVADLAVPSTTVVVVGVADLAVPSTTVVVVGVTDLAVPSTTVVVVGVADLAVPRYITR